MAQVNREKVKRIGCEFLAQLKHASHLSISLVEADEQQVLLELPYQKHVIGNPTSGVLHSGVITTLMDTASAISVMTHIFFHEHQLELCPTLDLRVDYMKPAKPNQTVFGLTHCYKLSKDVAFTRGVAYQNSPDEPIAHVVGSFMRIGTDMMSEQFRKDILKE